MDVGLIVIGLLNFLVSRSPSLLYQRAKKNILSKRNEIQLETLYNCINNLGIKLINNFLFASKSFFPSYYSICTSCRVRLNVSCYELNKLAYSLFDNFIFLLKQVQEKKVKKISDINVAGNGSIASSSVSSIPKQCIANGDYSDRSDNSLTKDLSSSLRLPVVVVLSYIFTGRIKDFR